MNRAGDAADRFFERYCPGPLDILMAGLRWLISDKGSESMAVVVVALALVVGLVYGPEWAARSFEVVGR